MGRRRKKNQKSSNLVVIVVLAIMFMAVNWLNPNMQDTTEPEQNALVNMEDDLQIHFIDQTTTNMIQGLKGIFARKPLISRGI